jgi:NitT/TauT family transport system ATP-binding protein
VLRRAGQIRSGGVATTLADESHAVDSGIRLDGVSKAFDTTVAVEDISLDLAAGETVTLLGPSGCGKTTLLRMIAGLETPSSGAISIDGAAPSVARSAKRIGFVPQAPALLPWKSVEANARLLVDLNSGATMPGAPGPSSLLDAVGLGDVRDAYPHELSGGMQQRVALVRAFALGAPYLLMDEPFAALDEITRTDMRHLLAQLAEAAGAAVVFVTHSIAEAVYLSDRVVVLSPRPARVVSIESIDFPRPRRPEIEETTQFFEHERRVRSSLRAGTER